MRRLLTIRQKLILAFVAVMIPFLLLQIIAYRNRLNSRRTLLLQMQIQRSQDIGRGFERYIEDLQREARAVGTAIAQSRNHWTSGELVAYLTSLHDDYRSVRFLAWATPGGKVIASSSRTPAPIDITDREYYRQVVRGQSWNLSDLLISKRDGKPCFILAHGIRTGGRLTGIMLLVVDPTLLQNDLDISSILPGSTVVITDSAGRLAYHNRYSSLSWRARDWSHVPMVQAAVKGRWGYDYDAALPLSGQALVGAQTPTPSLKWTAGTYRPVEAAMAPAWQDFRNNMLLSLAVAVLVSVGILYMGNRFTKPITEMADAAVEIARGKLSKRVKIHTGDEMELLAAKFNFMAESLEQVQKVARQLLTDAPIDEMLQSLVRGAAIVMGTRKVGLFLYDADARRISHAASHGLSDEYIKLASSLPGAVSVCGRASISLHTAVVDVRNDAPLRPYLDVMEREGIGTIVCVPLLTGTQELLGDLAGYFPPGAAPTEEQVSALNFFAAQAGVALENAQLHRDTERRARELQILWEVGQAIALKLDLDDLASTLAERLSALLEADDCCLAVYSDETGQMSPIGHSLAEGSTCPIDRALRCSNLAVGAVQSGQPATGERSADQAEESSEHILSVPMMLRGRPMGSICLFKEGGEFGEGQVRLASALAGVAAIAIENAKSYAKERRISETLQSSFLPRTDFSTEQTDVAEVYRAALEEASIGGDFFDVVNLSEGRMGLVIADVAGKGLQAAVHTAMVKYMLQAYAHQHQHPSEVLTNLNKAFNAQLDPDSFVTLFFGIFDPSSGQLVYANAGHEMPAMYRPGVDGCETLDVTGPALGAFSDAEYAERAIGLPAGSVLVMYTDGISEARTGTNMFGLEGVQSVLMLEKDRDARSIADAIVEAASAHAHGRLRDDVALLVLKFCGAPVASRS